MVTTDGRLFVYARSPATPRAFIAYWADCYDYGEEALYTKNIAGPHTSESLRQLFQWKIGKRFFAKHWPDVERHFVSRQEELRQLSAEITAETLLASFASGGAIYRIFWIHCWRPDRFPIYDQHVHRAMTFIEEGTRQELDRFTDAQKVRLYLDRYLPFWRRFEPMDPRQVDKALWTFGKFIKRRPLAIE